MVLFFDSSYILDTNTLLFACLVEESFVSDMVEELISLEGVVLITQRVIDEAVSVAGGVQDDGDRLFLLALGRATNKYDWLFVDDSEFPQILEDEFKNDTHIFSAARKLNAEVITSDLELIIKLRKNGCSARSPVMQRRKLIEAQRPHDMGLEQIAKLYRFGSTKGAVYIRADPEAWNGRTGIGKFSLFDFEGFGWCYYDSDSRCWVFKTDYGVKLSIPWESVDRDVFVSVSFKSIKRKKLSYTFRVSEVGKSPEAQNCQLEFDAVELGRGRISLGHNRSARCHWNGAIYTFLVTPNSLPNKAWKKLLDLKDEVPDPSTADTLKYAIFQCRWDLRDDTLRLCEFNDVVRYLASLR